ncbi:MAG: GAF domain-containing protein [Pseudomonadota bacterium]
MGTIPDPDAIAQAREDCLQRIRRGEPAEAVLHALACAIDRIVGDGGAASILFLDERGRLRSAASPRLPPDYLAAIDGLAPDPGVGTCAAAAATGEEVITPSFVACGRWRELGRLPLALGYVGAWSHPIRSLVDQRVLGTFGVYHRDVREPTELERAAVRQLAPVAARVLECQAGTAA